MNGPVSARRQRIGAYVVCVRADHVLLTRYSSLAPRPGWWALPGGGLDHGESPRAAAAREAWEETGLRIDVGPLLDVTSVHFTGVAPTGVVEDFHSIGLLFRGTTTDTSTPRVIEVGGTTDAVDWVPLADVEAGRIDLAASLRDVLPGLLTTAR